MVKMLSLIGIFLVALLYRLPVLHTPSVVIGSLVPVMVFLVGKKLFDRNTGIAAALFTIFSYLEIAWSKQAQEYILLQLVILLSIWVYTGLVKNFSVPRLAVLVVLGVVGWFTHISYAFFLLALLFHFIYLCFHWNFFNNKDLFRFSPYILFFTLTFLLLIRSTYPQIQAIMDQVMRAHPNNFVYYYRLLWKDHSIMTFLAGIGVLLNALKYKKGTFLIVVPIACYLFFLTFFIVPTFPFFILPIYPLILLMGAYAISTVSTALHPKLALLLVLIVTFFIIMNDDSFVLRPQPLNSDMTEIASKFN